MARSGTGERHGERLGDDMVLWVNGREGGNGTCIGEARCLGVGCRGEGLRRPPRARVVCCGKTDGEGEKVVCCWFCHVRRAG